MRIHIAILFLGLWASIFMPPANSMANRYPPNSLTPTHSNQPTACVAEYTTTFFGTVEWVHLKATHHKARFRFDDINLCTGPGLRHCVVRVLSSAKGKPLQVTHQLSYWRGVVFEEKRYWVHASLLTGY